MTSSHLPRRAVVGAVLATSLIGGGIVPLLAAHADECHALTDPKGDSKFAVQGQTVDQDPDMDILSIDHAIVGDNFVSTIKVADLLNAPSQTFGDRFDAGYTVGGKVVNAYVTRYDPSQIGTVADAGGNGFYQNAVQVGGTEVDGITVTAKYDEKADTVAISYKVADVEKATGAKLAGATLSKLTGNAAAMFVATRATYDTAAGTADYVLGTCEGAAGSAPAAAGNESPAAPPTAAAPAPAAGGDPSKLPNADCFLAKDPKGDGHVINSNVPNDPDLDITGLTMGSDATTLYSYIKVDKLGAGPSSSTDGHRYYLNFTFNKHAFTAAGSAYKNAASGQVRDGLANSGQISHVTQLSMDGSTGSPGYVASTLKFVFDQKNSVVIVVLPLADLEKAAKAPTAGAVFTGVYAGSYADTDALAEGADVVPDGSTATAPGKLTYTVGDSACFGAAAASGSAASPLTNAGVTKAQYGDSAAVAAKLVDASGAPVAGKDVTFALPSSTVTATTGADGVAKAALPIKDKAGKSSLVLTSGDAKTTVDFTVLVEKTVLKATGSKGTVTAALTDDDKTPVSGQVVTFTSGSKKVTAKTNAKGVATAKGLRGNVKVTYAGAAGMYTAASTSTKA